MPALAFGPLLSMMHSARAAMAASVISPQSRQFLRDGVEHRWAPSTAFYLPDGMQEWIGEKDVGILTLALSRNTHQFAATRPEGLIRHNILDHPQLYPGIPALPARLGAGAAL
jgi:hypothetical protein